MSATRDREIDTEESRRQLAALLDAARQEFVADIERGLGAASAHVRFSDHIDELVRRIVDAARPRTSTPFAVAALGGYGRRLLCLHSDVDLLIVFDGRILPAEEQFVKAMLHPLWDLRLMVGHQVRVLTDFDELEPDNPEFLLALLDARLLAGDAAVMAQVRERLQPSNGTWREHVVDARREPASHRGEERRGGDRDGDGERREAAHTQGNHTWFPPAPVAFGSVARS